MARKSCNETESDWNAWGHVPINRVESDPGVGVWSEGRKLGENWKLVHAEIE